MLFFFFFFGGETFQMVTARTYTPARNGLFCPTLSFLSFPVTRGRTVRAVTPENSSWSKLYTENEFIFVDSVTIPCLCAYFILRNCLASNQTKGTWPIFFCSFFMGVGFPTRELTTNVCVVRESLLAMVVYYLREILYGQPNWLELG